MSETTTANGIEIKRSKEKLDPDSFKELVAQFGIEGTSAEDRLEQLKLLSAPRLAVLFDQINRGLQGSSDSLIEKDVAMKIGETQTIAPEYRYDVFTKLIDDIRQAPDSTNPERIGDVLGLGVVLLHPFKDGNGRTARVIGMLLHHDYDQLDYREAFDQVAESRDAVRERGGFAIYGYTPQFPEGFDQSDPTAVSEYLKSLLESDEHSYIGPFLPASVHKPAET